MKKILNSCLTLICHKSLEERLIDQLLNHPEWVSGFTVGKVQGHSLKESLPSVMEQVRGRSQRIKIRCVMNLEDAHALVTHLKAQEANGEIAYWISPVIEYGRLA